MRPRAPPGFQDASELELDWGSSSIDPWAKSAAVRTACGEHKNGDKYADRLYHGTSPRLDIYEIPDKLDVSANF